MDIARTPQTAEASTVHKPFAAGGKGLWGTGRQLPAYVQSVAHHLVTQGMDESRAIGEAVGIVKNWAHGHDGHGHPVHPDVQAAAAKAIAEWERLRAEAHAKRSTVDLSAADRALRSWNPDAHPRVAAGSAGGGEFAPASGGSGSGGKTAKGTKGGAHGSHGAHTRPTPSNAHPVGLGERGQRVHDLQERLNALGAHLKLDGIFGPKTLAAVREFQRTHKDAQGRPLKVDGLVGPLTTAALRMKAAAKPAHHAPAQPSHQVHAKRSTPMATDGSYDEDGLDGSWDGPLDDLPSLTGLDVGDFQAVDEAESEPASRAMPKLGTGARFAKLKAALAAKGASDPGALAAYIGKKKYGKSRFASLVTKARRHKGGGMSRSELLRFYPLEDIHILTRAEGGGSGTVVEAYATVFDEPAEIVDQHGHYMEVIDRTAFDDVLRRISRGRGGFASAVKVLYNHGKTMEGLPAPEYQVPLGVPVDIRPEARGLLTRTQYDPADPFAERILSKVKSGAITAQSFVGGIMRSSPELQGPGDRYRRRGGQLTTVRRMALGLREYGPVLFPAYTGAEILGVRMSIPGYLDDEQEAVRDEPGPPEAQECIPDMAGDDNGGTPEDVTSPRYHHHQLLELRTAEMRREAGMDRVRSPWQ